MSTVGAEYTIPPPFGIGEPPSRVPKRVSAWMATQGKVVRVSFPPDAEHPNGWFPEYRAMTDPLWVAANGVMWFACPHFREPGQDYGPYVQPIEGIDDLPDDIPPTADVSDPDNPPRLRVGLCTEYEWRVWIRTHQMPDLMWAAAGVVWIDVDVP